MIKPHIKWFTYDGCWICRGGGKTGIGKTPYTAYRNWLWFMFYIAPGEE